MHLRRHVINFKTVGMNRPYEIIFKPYALRPGRQKQQKFAAASEYSWRM